MNFKNLWWKILAMIILLYALIAGMMVPLKPGITGLSKSVFNAGEVAKFTVSGYNTIYDSKFFKEGGQAPKAYLKLDNNSFIEALLVNPTSNNKIDVQFDLPSNFPGNANFAPLSLLITDPYNGTIVYPDGVAMKRQENSSNVNWTRGELPKFYKKTGFLFPYRNILLETIRNTFYHVPLWFAMFILFFAAMCQSILFLIKKKIDYDFRASSLIYAGILLGVLGLVTGSLWAKDTWGTYWTTDVKLNMSAISMMIYLAYWILRSSLEDVDKKAKISAAYSIFAFFTIVPLIFVIPRVMDSLHPGNGGNPALGGEDMDNTMRMVFYPAIIGFTLLGVWIAQIILRMKRIKETLMLKMLK